VEQDKSDIRLIFTGDIVYGMRPLENVKFYVRIRSWGRREGGREGEQNVYPVFPSISSLCSCSQALLPSLPPSLLEQHPQVQLLALACFLVTMSSMIIALLYEDEGLLLSHPPSFPPSLPPSPPSEQHPQVQAPSLGLLLGRDEQHDLCLALRGRRGANPGGRAEH